MSWPKPVHQIHTPGVFADQTQAADAFSDEEMAGPPRYFDVDGLPVSFGRVKGCPFRCAMWANGRPMMFSEARVRERGKPISEAGFRDLIAACRLGY